MWSRKSFEVQRPIRPGARFPGGALAGSPCAERASGFAATSDTVGAWGQPVRQGFPSSVRLDRGECNSFAAPCGRVGKISRSRAGPLGGRGVQRELQVNLVGYLDQADPRFRLDTEVPLPDA